MSEIIRQSDLITVLSEMQTNLTNWESAYMENTGNLTVNSGPTNMVTSSSGGGYVPPTTTTTFGEPFYNNWGGISGYWTWVPYQPYTNPPYIPPVVSYDFPLSQRLKLAMEIVKALPAEDPLAIAARAVLTEGLK